jgi:hypothetical protein
MTASATADSYRPIPSTSAACWGVVPGRDVVLRARIAGNPSGWFIGSGSRSNSARVRLGGLGQLVVRLPRRPGDGAAQPRMIRRLGTLATRGHCSACAAGLAGGAP